MPSIALLQRDDEASPRLHALIDATEDFWVCGTVHTVTEARQLIKQNSPDIVITDMRLQDGDVRPLLGELHQGLGGRDVHVLATLVSHDDALLLDALSAGADAYWIHMQAHDVLLAVLNEIWRGESPISPTIARQLLLHFSDPKRARFDSMTEALDPLVLTASEQEILQWVSQGYLVDEIAQRSHATPHSVACGIRRVYRKLQFESRASGLSLQLA